MALAEPQGLRAQPAGAPGYDREHPDALIVPGHDMAHWETLAERYE